MTIHISSQTNIAESKVLQNDCTLTYQNQNGDMITKCQPSLHGNISGKERYLFKLFFPTMYIQTIITEIQNIAVPLFK